MVQFFLFSASISFWLCYGLKKLSTYWHYRKLANRQYDTIVIAYEDMLEIRKEHYNANFIEDPEVKLDIQSKCENLYKKCNEILDYVDFELLDFLPKWKQEEVLDIINTPRYKLI